MDMLMQYENRSIELLTILEPCRKLEVKQMVREYRRLETVSWNHRVAPPLITSNLCNRHGLNCFEHAFGLL